MLREKQRYLHHLEPQEFLEAAEALCYESLEVEPVYECIKVFARLTESGELSYARHKSDLGTSIVTPSMISSRLKNDTRAEVVNDALAAFEEAVRPIWPFAPGSSSWLQLEVLHPEIKLKGPVNRPSIVIRKAVRLSSLKRSLPTTTSPLVERLFYGLRENVPASSRGYQILFAPTVNLKNIAGSGVISEGKDSLERGSSFDEVSERIVRSILESNFSYPAEINPGFYVKFRSERYRVVSTSYKECQLPRASRSTAAPLPIVGLIR